MILKAEDDKKEVTFECIGIERLINLEVTRLSEGRKELVDPIYTEPIKFYKAQYRKVSRKEAEQNIRELLKDTVMYWFKRDLDREALKRDLYIAAYLIHAPDGTLKDTFDHFPGTDSISEIINRVF